jgi:hypothetical protein
MGPTLGLATGGAVSPPEPGRAPCAICRRPVWDEARPLELDDSIAAVVSPVHRGCARHRARLERELELAARKGRAQIPPRTEADARGVAARGGLPERPVSEANLRGAWETEGEGDP